MRLKRAIRVNYGEWRDAGEAGIRKGAADMLGPTYSDQGSVSRD